MYFHFIFLLTVNIKKTWVAAIPGKSLVPGYSHDVFFTLKPRHPDIYIAITMYKINVIDLKWKPCFIDCTVNMYIVWNIIKYKTLFTDGDRKYRLNI